LLNTKQIARKLRCTDGAEVLEAAIVLPVVFLLLLGIVWFGRAFNIYSTISHAAQQGAIRAARETGGTGVPDPATADNADTEVMKVLNASNLDSAQIQQWEANNPDPANPTFQPCPDPAPPVSCTLTTHSIWVCSSVLLDSTTKLCGSLVSFRYKFKSYLPFSSLNLQPVILSAEAQSRMEN
jgi:Flp pilus assembly protein TadG